MNALEQAVIAAAESRQFGSQQKPAMKAVARQFVASRNKVSRLARELGVSKARYKDTATHRRTWTEAESATFEDNLHKNAVSIQKALKRAGYERTLYSIASRRSRFCDGYAQARADAGLYSPTTLGRLMGVSGKAVQNWITQGLLAAKKVESNGNRSGYEYEITEAQVRAFVFAHPLRVNPAKAEWLWLVSVLEGAMR
jgi:transposase-like protein